MQTSKEENNPPPQTNKNSQARLRNRKKNNKKKKKGKQLNETVTELQVSGFSHLIEQESLNSTIPLKEDMVHNLSFKTEQQKGASKSQSTAANTPMKPKNQPMINGKSQRRTAQTTQHIERSSVIVRNSKEQHILPANIYGYVHYDMESVFRVTTQLIKHFTNKQVTSQIFSKKLEISKIHAASIFIGLAQQIQNTMSMQQAMNDPFRGFLNTRIKMMPQFKNLILTFGAFKTERGHFYVEAANTYVAQLYAMAISKIVEVDPETKRQHGYTDPNYPVNLIQQLTKAVFTCQKYDRDKFVYGKMRKVWQGIAESKEFTIHTSNLFEQYPRIEQLYSLGGSQWALASRNAVAIAITNIHDSIVLDFDYDGDLPAIGLNVCNYQLDTFLPEIKKATDLIQSTQKDSNYDGTFEIFQPCKIDQVNGRWQLMQSTPTPTKYKSKFVVRKDEAQFGFVLDLIENVQIISDLKVAPQQHPDVLIKEGLEQDILY